MAMVATLSGTLSNLRCQSCAPAQHNLAIGCGCGEQFVGHTSQLQCQPICSARNLVYGYGGHTVWHSAE